jgi:hypothetical protein
MLLHCHLQCVKLYFIGLHSATPHEVDMSHIYSFDAVARVMVPHTPKVLGADKHEDMFDPVMRIRCVALTAAASRYVVAVISVTVRWFRPEPWTPREIA